MVSMPRMTLSAALLIASLISHAKAQTYRVGDAKIRAEIAVNSGHVQSLTIHDGLHPHTVAFAAPFRVTLADGSSYSSSDMVLEGKVSPITLAAHPNASRMAERTMTRGVEAHLHSADGRIRVDWKVLSTASNYLRETVTLMAAKDDLPIRTVELLHWNDADAKVVGTVKGSPIVSGNMFFGFEHPLSESSVKDGVASAWITRTLPLKQGQSITYSAVFGTTREGQMRRDFLAYVERERAHPYRTFLHPNSWYDLGYFTPYDEATALNHIDAFGKELHDKRGVTLDSYLFDDGWDDHTSLWHFHPKDFPNGFTKVREETAKFGYAPGVWMSPWGGYSKPKKDRVNYGREQGYEIVDNGFALSGPKYYERFREVCLEMVRKYGINQFKFDGTGNADRVFPGSAFDSDFAAALALIDDLRREKPDIYINLTTGTYPSPFWLRTADSIWRGGEDDDFAGVGNWREKWITYRDADTYQRVVQAGPLFPLNSLMLHGIIYAEKHKKLNVEYGESFRNEVRSYFGTGTQLQELYITPSLLSQQNWDDLAEAAKWSRANADVLKDTHWVGGDPVKLQVYGWAAWSAKKSILTLRNPSDKPQSITLDVAKVLEVPKGQAMAFAAQSPWKGDASSLTIRGEHSFALQPFEVKTVVLTPAH